LPSFLHLASFEPCLLLMRLQVPKHYIEKDLVPLFNRHGVVSVFSQPEATPACLAVVIGAVTGALSCSSCGYSAIKAAAHVMMVCMSMLSTWFSTHRSLPLHASQVRDCIVLKDKVTGQPRGAAFVSYGTREEAEAAIQALNRQIQLPGALCPLEVSGWPALRAHTCEVTTVGAGTGAVLAAVWGQLHSRSLQAGV
jgi:RNA recognition motif-containing protein